jgi:hypothetical protein
LLAGARAAGCGKFLPFGVNYVLLVVHLLALWVLVHLQMRHARPSDAEPPNRSLSREQLNATPTRLKRNAVDVENKEADP